MLTLAVINEFIAKDYDCLKARFQAVKLKRTFPFSFQDITEQFTWATNEAELTRGLHRLHCLLSIDLNIECEQQLNSENYLNLQHQIQQWSDDQFAAQLFLTTVDACKRSSEAVKSFDKPNAQMDALPFCIETLRDRPEIYSLYAKLSDESKTEVANFAAGFIHVRHACLGEAPEDALLHNILKPDINLSHLQTNLNFWILNSFAFAIKEPSSHNQAMGPALSNATFLQQSRIHTVLRECLNQKSAEPMKRFYRDVLTKYFHIETINQDVHSFLSRVCMMLENHLPDHSDLIRQVLNNLFQYHFEKLLLVAKLETRAFSETEIQAISFLPAVYWKLLALQAKTKYTDASVKVLSEAHTLCLQVLLQVLHHLFEFLLSNPNSLNGNVTLPLFELANLSDDLLSKLIAKPTSDLKFAVSISQFISLNVSIVQPCTSKEAPHSVVFAPALDKVTEHVEASSSDVSVPTKIGV